MPASKDDWAVASRLEHFLRQATFGAKEPNLITMSDEDFGAVVRVLKENAQDNGHLPFYDRGYLFNGIPLKRDENLKPFEFTAHYAS